MVPHLHKLLEVSSFHGIINKINTNGRLLTKEKLAQIKNDIRQVTFSIDTLNDNTNEIIGRNGHHRQIVLDRIDLVKDAGLDVVVNTVVIKQNLNDILELGETLQNKGVNKWRLLRFSPLRYDAVKNQNTFDTTDTEYQNIVSEASAKYPDFNINSRLIENLGSEGGVVTPSGHLIISRPQYLDIGDISKCI
jgi:MoaA/NifB/PqqE/SkfB family radical SAM enzyme